MIIVYGTRCYGKSDVIEGLGHVTTRFVHIMFVPLVPIETVFMLPDDRGMKLPFSFKSALSGWLRAGAILGGLGALAGGIAAFADEEILGGIVLIVMAFLAFGSFPVWGMLFGKCSPQRKAELAGMFGIDPSELGVPSAAAPAPAQQGYGQQQQPGYGQQPAYGQPPAYGQQPGYGAPPPAYGAPPAGGFGNPQPQPGGYGGPPGYGAPPAAPGYAAPPAAPGYGAPPAAPGYGAPQAHGPSAPPAAPHGYGGPQPGGYGAPPPGYGPQGWDPNRR